MANTIFDICPDEEVNVNWSALFTSPENSLISSRIKSMLRNARFVNKSYTVIVSEEFIRAFSKKVPF